MTNVKALTGGRIRVLRRVLPWGFAVNNFSGELHEQSELDLCRRDL
jgi:hypothetical protein